MEINRRRGLGGVFRRKPAESDLNTRGGRPQLARRLSLFDLVAIGVGATIGAGVYILVGTVAREHTGPALTFSFMIAGIAAALSALCYSELACRCPSAGSAYHYSYICIGEGVAWLIGWSLILEFTLGGSAVARGISPNLALFFGGPDKLPSFLARQSIQGIVVDPCAAILVFLMTALLCTGIKESSLVQGIITTTNIGAMLFIFVAGGYLGFKTGWAGYENSDGYLPFGVNGLLAGSGTLFFSYVGFDCLTSTAEEAKNPQRDLPLAIAISLMICGMLYMLVSMVIVGLVPYYALDPDTPISSAFGGYGLNWAVYIITTGAITALCASLIGAILPQPRILMSMARDGLLPSFFSDINKKTRVPVKGHHCNRCLHCIVGLFYGCFPVSRDGPKPQKRIVLDGPRSSGKSIALAMLVHWARSEGWLVLYVPKGREWTHGGFFYKNPNTGLWDTPAQAANVLQDFLKYNQKYLEELPCKLTEPITLGEGVGVGWMKGVDSMPVLEGSTLYDLVQTGIKNTHASVGSLVRLREELLLVEKYPVLIAVDQYNSWFTFSEFGEPITLRSCRPIHARELTTVNAFRSMMHKDLMMVGAFSHSTAVGKLRKDLPDVPLDNRVNFPRYNVDEAATVFHYYVRQMLVPQEAFSEENWKKIFYLSYGNGSEMRQLTPFMSGHQEVISWGNKTDPSESPNSNPNPSVYPVDVPPMAALNGDEGFLCGILAYTSQPFCWDTLGSNFDLVPDSFKPNAYFHVSAGKNHVCAIRGTYFGGSSWGSVDCWDIVTKPDRIVGSRPSSLFLDQNISNLVFKKLVSGDGFSCGVVREGGFHCWGPNAGTLGNISLSDDLVALASGNGAICVVKEVSGEVKCWGDDNAFGLPPTGIRFVSLTAGAQHFCGIREDDHGIECWGNFNSTLVPKGSGFLSIASADVDVVCG